MIPAARGSILSSSSRSFTSIRPLVLLALVLPLVVGREANSAGPTGPGQDPSLATQALETPGGIGSKNALQESGGSFPFRIPGERTEPSEPGEAEFAGLKQQGGNP